MASLKMINMYFTVYMLTATWW